MRRSYIPSTAKLQKAPQAFMCEIVHSNSCLYVSYLSSFLNFQITHLFIRCENLHLHNLCHLNVLTGMASTRFHFALPSHLFYIIACNCSGSAHTHTCTHTDSFLHCHHLQSTVLMMHVFEQIHPDYRKFTTFIFLPNNELRPTMCVSLFSLMTHLFGWQRWTVCEHVEGVCVEKPEKWVNYMRYSCVVKRKRLNMLKLWFYQK